MHIMNVYGAATAKLSGGKVFPSMSMSMHTLGERETIEGRVFPSMFMSMHTLGERETIEGGGRGLPVSILQKAWQKVTVQVQVTVMVKVDAARHYSA
jgi:hypothetical protein